MRDVEIKIIVSDKLIYAENDEAPRTPIIAGPAIIFKVKEVPAALPMGISIIGIGANDGNEHEFQFKIIELESGISIYDSGVSKFVVPTDSPNFAASGNLNSLEFQKIGTYSVVVTFDNIDYTDHFYIEEI